MDLKFVSKSTEAATIALIRERATGGDASAQYVLGLIHADRWRFTEAEGWFQMAAEQGHAGAECELGISYDVHHADYANAVKWYRRAADHGDVKAQCLMGYSYKRNGDSVEAEQWFRRAAEHGDMEAQFCMARMYLDADGVPQDFPECQKWLQTAAENGHAMAQFLMGDWHQEEDPIKAESWYRKVAGQRDVDRLYEYAYEYTQEARIAEESAQAALNDLREFGQFIPKDQEKAAELYRKLSDTGNAQAQYRLATVYEMGWGVEKDHEAASRQYWKAANQGNADALAHFGVVYSLEGPSQDHVQAYKWLSLAVSASSKDRKYDHLLNEIAADMTPQQMAEAKILAQQWKTTK